MFVLCCAVPCCVVLCCVVLPCPALPCHVLGCPVLSSPVLFCPVPSCPVPSGPGLSRPAPPRPALSCQTRRDEARRDDTTRAEPNRAAQNQSRPSRTKQERSEPNRTTQALARKPVLMGCPEAFVALTRLLSRRRVCTLRMRALLPKDIVVGVPHRHNGTKSRHVHARSSCSGHLRHRQNDCTRNASDRTACRRRGGGAPGSLSSLRSCLEATGTASIAPRALLLANAPN